MRRLVPDSLSGRLIALLLLALTLAQLASLLVFNHERGRAAELAARNHVQSRIVSTTRLMLQTPAAQRPAELRRAQTRGLRLFLARAPRRIGPAQSSAELAFAARLREELGDQAGRIHVRLRSGEDEKRPFVAVAVEFDDGAWLMALKALREPPPRWSPASLLALLLSALFAVIAVIVGVRGITTSLRRLSDAADKLGRGEDVRPLPETGPADLRRAASAFNQMRERLQRFVSERTHMLAAISHDLRTPITALRLRAEFIDDDENRGRILEILEDMRQMTDATLDLARGEHSAESSEIVDLTALAEALADDYQAMGRAVACEISEPVLLRCRRASIKRALQNLVNNALDYGQRADIAVALVGRQIRLSVTDDGPGIPAADHKRVFDPFVRLEPSRNADSGGIGLGLAIARDIIRAHGGDIRLDRDHSGRFRMNLCLPCHLPDTSP